MILAIIELVKEQNIKPSAPLSIAVVSSQIAIAASLVSVAVVYMTEVLEPLDWNYPLYHKNKLLCFKFKQNEAYSLYTI